MHQTKLPCRLPRHSRRTRQKRVGAPRASSAWQWRPAPSSSIPRPTFGDEGRCPTRGVCPMQRAASVVLFVLPDPKPCPSGRSRGASTSRTSPLGRAIRGPAARLTWTAPARAPGTHTSSRGAAPWYEYRSRAPSSRRRHPPQKRRGCSGDGPRRVDALSARRRSDRIRQWADWPSELSITNRGAVPPPDETSPGRSSSSRKPGGRLGLFFHAPRRPRA
mmetsp:Transcript_5856/g.17484  ORF Transcript_5856/g.17484 Transcript_5856/m.17484 type:complete len:219 (-) Transcript_5856:2188-2844(-)